MLLLLIVGALSSVMMLCTASYLAGVKSGVAARRRLQEYYVGRLNAMRRASE